MISKALPTAALTCALLAGCVATTTSNPHAPTRTDATRAAAFASKLDTLRNAHHIPGLAVVVLRGTDVVLAQGFGEADRERHIAVTPDTPFDIASVAKPIHHVPSFIRRRLTSHPVAHKVNAEK